MTLTRAQALERAKASTTYAVGMCLQWTRLQYGIPGGTPDAATAWRNARRKHTDRKPPAGVPVFWTGGRNGHGHVAISLGDGRIRGTDSPTPGRIGTVSLDWPEKSWGLKFAGWSEDLNGVTIPTGSTATPQPAPAAPAPSRLTRVRFHHCSMQWSDPAEHKRTDAARAFARDAHVITFTEVGKGQNPTGLDALEREARRRGYTFHQRGDGAVATRFRRGRVTSHGYEGPLIPGVPGDHPHLGLTWVTVRHDTLGVMTFGVSHWLTRDNEPGRARQNNAMTRAIGDFLAEKAKGDRLAFLAGDVNRDDATRDVLPGTDFRTVWDELGKHPDTHGRRTIDVIASYRPDARVRALEAGLLPAARSDHRWITAVYGIRPL